VGHRADELPRRSIHAFAQTARDGRVSKPAHQGDVSADADGGRLKAAMFSGAVSAKTVLVEFPRHGGQRKATKASVFAGGSGTRRPELLMTGCATPAMLERYLSDQMNELTGARWAYLTISEYFRDQKHRTMLC
jgi:F0F1-type ATP synthase beta subunit